MNNLKTKVGGRVVDLGLGSSGSKDAVLKHALIFNFNGAEETNWQAAHGFITQHRWRDTIRGLINLEGSGAGGRETVLQTGPKHEWIARAFAKVCPRPNGNTVVQEVFQSGKIPGATDFETYVEYAPHKGQVAGIDFVFLDGGYVYHTTRDDMDHVTPGTLQHTGDNVLAMAKAMASSSFLADAKGYRHTDAVYFDVLGLFVVVFSHGSAAPRSVFRVLRVFHFPPSLPPPSSLERTHLYPHPRSPALNPPRKAMPLRLASRSS